MMLHCRLGLPGMSLALSMQILWTTIPVSVHGHKQTTNQISRNILSTETKHQLNQSYCSLNINTNQSNQSYCSLNINTNQSNQSYCSLNINRQPIKSVVLFSENKQHNKSNQSYCSLNINYQPTNQITNLYFIPLKRGINMPQTNGG